MYTLGKLAEKTGDVQIETLGKAATRKQVYFPGRVRRGKHRCDMRPPFEKSPSWLTQFTGENVKYVLMILPQVHLRKPCYDFYFL
jgi:hypothetical protein